MPLLGKKIFNIGPNLTNCETEEAPYLIPHTNERFQSKSEYEKRVDLYGQSIWTCRATGHTSLTHEEACKSEKDASEQLKTQFPKCFEKDVLTLVHHNTVSLETLVDKMWWKFHQRFVIGERVNLQVKVADKLIPAKILSLDADSKASKETSTCNSPSSDKENSTEEKDKDKSPKKWVPPKMLPFNYVIELEDEAKIIHSVPATDLLRVEKAPGKDLLRLFIRVSSVRSGTTTTSPWVVNPDLVKKYKLISKFADFFLSPAKMSEAFKKAGENGKKRKLSNGTIGSASKKLKIDEVTATTKTKDKQKSSQRTKDEKNASVPKKKRKKKNTDKDPKTGMPKKKIVSQSKKISSLKMKNNKDSTSKNQPVTEEECCIVDSDSDVPLYQLIESSTPKKQKKKQQSLDEDVPLSKMITTTPKKSNPGTPKKKATPSKAQKKNEKTPEKKKTKKVSKQGEEQKKGALKQVTLYDLTKKGKLMQQKIAGSVLHEKSPSKAAQKSSPPKPPPTPAIVRRLLGSKRETMTERMKYSALLKKAVDILTPVQVKHLPEKLRDEYDRKKRFMEEKAKLERMTAEEREVYIREKREKAKQAQKQRVLQKLRDQRKRFEDTDLNLTQLPTAKLVPTPDGFPNELFGDVVMVTEFINCYSGLLMPESEYPIYTDALMKALVGGSSGFTYLSRVLVVLLQTLLQDQIAKGYKELKTKLSDIAVSAYTASELVRLCLSCEDGDNSDDEDEEGDVPEEYVRLLREYEFYQLDLSQKLCVLRGLCTRVLATYSVQDYMEEQQRTATRLTRQKNTEIKEMVAQNKSQKQTLPVDVKASTPASTNEKDEKEVKNTASSLSILSFYGKEVDDSGEEGKDWGTIVKRRRIMAAKAAAEKERLEKEKMALREKEYEEERKKDKLRKKQEGINLARMVLRQDPIGTDRHHDRYWVFTNTTPGLYVEKGWMGEEVNYNVKKLKKVESEAFSSEEEEEEEEQEDKPTVAQTGMTPLKVVYRVKKHFIETSTPHPGQNLWFTYRSAKDLDGLLKSLHPQGIRESLLKAEINKQYDDISRAILQAQRTKLELRDSDGDVEMVAGFKKELSDMELRLRNGGLGGVPNYESWESRLMDATDISTMGECMLVVKEAILEKFLQGFMKSVVRSPEEETKDDPGNDLDKVKEEDDDASAKTSEKEDKREKVVREWQESVEQCQTLSRLHVLMAMLDACIKWEKSAENAKCKICRKKTDDDRLLLCDECNQAFHMYCLRPALVKLPSGDWFCPACKPRRSYVRQVEQSDSEEEEEEEVAEKEEECRECGGSDKLIFCTKCPAAFHTQCHDPPLRHPPRGVWECSECKSGATRRRGKYARKASSKKRYQQEVASSEDDEEEDESEPERQKSSRSRSQDVGKRKKGPSRPRRTARTNRSSRSRASSQSDVNTSITPSRMSRRGPSELSLCEEVLQRVVKHKAAWPFLEPVNKKLVPDYYLLIKKPMDFQTMQKKCARLSYASPQEFVEDAALVFENAEIYNKSDSEVYSCMHEAEKLFKEALQKFLPDWPYYRTVVDKEENSSGSEPGRRRSRSKF